MAKENISLNVPQAADDFKMLFPIPWFHHQRIIDKCKDDMDKALFFVRKTWENNWGRDALLNWLDTDLYERDGKAITNFQSTLPAVQSDLAQQITKDPYQIIQGTDGNINYPNSFRKTLSLLCRLKGSTTLKRICNPQP